MKFREAGATNSLSPISAFTRVFDALGGRGLG